MLNIKTIAKKTSLALNTIPAEDIDRNRYAEKIKKYSTACGCGAGAVFLFVSLGVYLFRVFVWLGWKNVNLLSAASQGSLFVFVSAIIGKIAGIGVARLKLIILYYSFHKKQKQYHVNMYEMDR